MTIRILWRILGLLGIISIHFGLLAWLKPSIELETLIIVFFTAAYGFYVYYFFVGPLLRK